MNTLLIDSLTARIAGIDADLTAIEKEQKAAVAPHVEEIEKLRAQIQSIEETVFRIKRGYAARRAPLETDKWFVQVDLAALVAPVKAGDIVSTNRRSDGDRYNVRSVEPGNSHESARINLRKLRKDGAPGTKYDYYYVSKDSSWHTIARPYVNDAATTTATATTAAA